MKSEFTLGMCVLIYTYLIWEACTLNTYYSYIYFNESILFQYVDKIVQSSISQLPAVAHLQYPEPIQHSLGDECSPTTHWGWQSLPVMPVLKWKLCACHRQRKCSTLYFERMLLATYCITLIQAISQSYFTDEKDKKGTWLICLKLQRESTGVKEMGTQSSSSSFLCSGHLLIIIWQCLNEITRNTNANKTCGNVVPHSPLLQVAQCGFQNDKTWTNLRVKTSKKWRETCTRIPMQVNSTKVPVQSPIHAAFHRNL